MSICVFPGCRDAGALEGIPICGRHAQAVYLAVKDRIDNATLAQRMEAASRVGGSNPQPGYSSRPGTVYFARFGYLIKIGFTTDLDGRMKSLRPDEVLATMSGTMRDEKALHARFRRLRERDEYFLPGPELTEFIDRIKQSPEGVPA